MKKLLGPNKGCKYYPCHDNIEDCTWCYCPIYPCGDESRGGYYLKNKKTEKIVWACEKCNWIHQIKNAKKYVQK